MSVHGKMLWGIEGVNNRGLDFYGLNSGAIGLDKQGNVIFERKIDKSVAKDIYDLYKDLMKIKKKCM